MFQTVEKSHKTGWFLDFLGHHEGGEVVMGKAVKTAHGTTGRED